MWEPGLYVEARILADLDELWTHTQDPALRRRWDLRLTRIDQLPRAEGGPLRYRYAARPLPFLTVTATAVGARERERPDGSRTSVLRFACAHPLSPLVEGSGYWRYLPDGDGVRFAAGCDYRPRWGRFGALADRWAVRPLTRWATAWSFDRLRLWLERGVTPERALRNWVAELAVRAAVAVGAAGALAAGLDPAQRVLGTFAASLAFLCPLLLSVALCLALFAPPLPGTPAARRCLRRPSDPVRPPRLMRALENP
ncbi:hypothetical protein [Streptomyces sp. bgisy153]|uniref:hypothetical protein n=1 Tax=Streptomyces sp. bgisy153 TaxID=3413793 RepID=UPI003D742976